MVAYNATRKDPPMNNTRKNNIGLWIGYLSLALGLSPVTTEFFPQIGNLIEPFIFIGIYLIGKYNEYRIPFIPIFKSQASIIVLFLLLCFALIGTLTPEGKSISDNDIYKYIYADFRSCYLFFFTVAFLLSSQWDVEQKVKFLRRLLWIIIILGFIFSRNRLIANAVNADGTIERTLGIPMHFLVLQNLLYCRTSKPFLHFVLLAMGAYYATFSFARINIVFFVVQVLIVTVPLLLSKSKSFLHVLLKGTMLISIIVFLLYIVPKAYDFYDSTEGGRAQINRIIGVGESVSEAEGERTKSLYVPFTDIDFFLMPEGLGWRNHIQKIGRHYSYKILSTQDSCWLYVFYHFGFFGGLICIFIIFSYIFRNVFTKQQYLPPSVLIERLLLLLCFLVCFFTQGVFFTVPQNAVAGGIMLALLSTKFSNQIVYAATGKQVKAQ